MQIFILLFILVPAAEIGVLLFSGKTIGVWPTYIASYRNGITWILFSKETRNKYDSKSARANSIRKGARE